MPLTPGSRIGPYTVLGPIGAGGMGEVYRARDEKVGRDVAIKVIPETFAADADRRERFSREARALGALNHPNIAAIYGLEDSGETHGLVMELVEGPTLADRIAAGPLPMDDALAIARQIAGALEAAHQAGIIHRDLKPANVKVRDDGTVKVLDFGLAKATGPAAESNPALVNSPTFTARATELGIVLGTSAYMAPEQAKGRTVDRRVDVWALGVVLYEMLTGRRAFDGADVSEVLAAVIKDTPSLDALPPDTPPSIRRLLRRCLEKDPAKRLDSMRVAQLEIDDAAAGAGDGTRSTITASPRTWISPVHVAVTVTVALLAGLGVYGWRSETIPAREPLYLSVAMAPTQQLASETSPTIEFSPDGRALFLPGRENGASMLFRRDLARKDFQPIPGTERGGTPRVSPDGRWVLFAAGSKLMKISADGGRPVPLADSIGAGGAAWLDDSSVVFAPIYSDGLFRISAEGGPPERLTTPDHAGGDLGHWWPDVLPGNRHVLFTAFRTPVDTSRIGVLDVVTRAVRWVVDGGFFGRYVASGHLLYARGERLYAVPFDAARGETTGPAVGVLDDLYTSQTNGTGTFAVSKQGTLAYVSASVGRAARDLIWIDRSGRVQPALNERRPYVGLKLSPDDRTVALTIQQEGQDLWTLSLERGTLSRLTSGPKSEFDPAWSPDGTELFYVIDRPPFGLNRIRADAPDSGGPLWKEPDAVDTFAPAVSPDGRWIVFVRSEPETGRNIYVRPIDGSAAPRAFRAGRASEERPAFSPDGRWLVYQSDETGRHEIYVEAFPGPGQRVQISSDGGSEPRWAASGEIFFWHDEELRVAASRTGATFSFEAPRTLFSLGVSHANGASVSAYDVTAKGDRVLATRVPDASVPRRIEIVTDWVSQLPRLAPPRR